MAELFNLDNRQCVTLLPKHVIGRHPASSQLVVSDPKVSRIHAAVSFDAGAWLIEDLSSNGTYLNGKPLVRSQPVRLSEGDMLSFADPYKNTWQVKSLSPPTDMLIPETPGATLVELLDFVVLPNEQNPQVSLYQDNLGIWQCEHAQGTFVLHSGDKVTAQGHVWRFVAGAGCAETELVAVKGLIEPGDISLRFDVSQNEEHVNVCVSLGDECFDLGERNHHYLALLLARQYLNDKAQGTAAKECGWLDKDLLANMLLMSEVNINMYIYRFRKQLIDALGDNWQLPQLIQRRHCEVRLVCDNIEVVGGLLV